MIKVHKEKIYGLRTFLHVHSEHSWLDGACIIDDLVQRAVELKMPAVAITTGIVWQVLLVFGITHQSRDKNQSLDWRS